MRTFALIALACLFMFGCASGSTKKEDAHALMQADLIDQAKASASAPLFKLTCPASGCVIASLEVANPAAAAQFAETLRVALAPQPSPGMQAFAVAMDAVKSLGAIGLVAHGVQGIMSAVVKGQTDTAVAGFNATSSTATAGFASNAAIAHLIPQPGATTNISVTASGPGAAASAGGSAAGSAPTTTTTTTTTNTNSNNTNPAPTVVTCTGTPPVCTR